MRRGGDLIFRPEKDGEWLFGVWQRAKRQVFVGLTVGLIQTINDGDRYEC